jgi:hypothetical protein
MLQRLWIVSRDTQRESILNRPNTTSHRGTMAARLKGIDMVIRFFHLTCDKRGVGDGVRVTGPATPTTITKETAELAELAEHGPVSLRVPRVLR